MWRNIWAWRSNGECWNDPVRTRKLAISIVLKNQHTVPGARAHTVVSHLDVVVRLFRLFYCSANNQQKETLSCWKCPTLQYVSSWLSWEFCTSTATRGSRSVSIHSILEYNFPLKRYTVIQLTCDRPNCVSWTRSVMPANRQLTMTARGMTMSRTQHYNAPMCQLMQN